MKPILVTTAVSLLAACLADGQGRPIDWPSYGGDAQRGGWEKSDIRITRENIKDFRLVLKMKLDDRAAGPRSLTPPVIIGNLISYRGFKELAFVAGSSGGFWAIDADLERLFWQRHFDGVGNCAAGQVAIPALTPPLNFGARRSRPSPTAPVSASPRVGGTGFGVTRSVFMLSGDGKLHQLNSADGSDQYPPLQFVPPNAKPSSLTLQDGIVYTTTSSGCGAPDGVWAINLNAADPKPVSFVSKSGSIGGIGGYALGADGIVYAQTADALVALTAGELKQKDYLAAPGGSATPVVFPWRDREVIVSAGRDGSLYLLDSRSLGGEDHKTPLYKTAPLAKAGHGAWGGISTWEDSDKTRWVAAPVWGPVNGEAPNGSIVAFKVEEKGGKPALNQAWVSRDMRSPEPPVITSGVLFALAAGGPAHATLYALDAATGKEIYSTAEQVSAPGNLTGIALTNGRIYFTTNDGALYAFGIFLER